MRFTWTASSRQSSTIWPSTESGKTAGLYGTGLRRAALTTSDFGIASPQAHPDTLGSPPMYRLERNAVARGAVREVFGSSMRKCLRRKRVAPAGEPRREVGLRPVSYTHLTLPTSDLV